MSATYCVYDVCITYIYQAQQEMLECTTGIYEKYIVETCIKKG